MVSEVRMSFFGKLFKKGNNKEIDYNNVPVHIAIIMDGNGRWAKKRGLPRVVGHREGANTLKKITAFCGDIGIKYLTVYAFSTENWSRPKDEVDGLMNLLLDFLKNAEKHIGGKNVQIRVIGDVSALSGNIQAEIERVRKITAKNTGIVLNIALNYGSKREIVNAIREITKDVTYGKYNVNAIDEKLVEKKLYTRDLPDPELMIRTSGEMRISNFLLWQSAYTELWFTDVLWPDLKGEHIIKAINEFQNRNRRYGGI